MLNIYNLLAPTQHILLTFAGSICAKHTIKKTEQMTINTTAG